MKAIDFIKANPELLHDGMRELKEIIEDGNEVGLEFFCPNNFLGHSYSNNVTFIQHWVSVPEMQAYVDLQESSMTLNTLTFPETTETHLFKLLGPKAVQYVLDKASDLNGSYMYFSENDFALLLRNRDSLDESLLCKAKYNDYSSAGWNDIPKPLTEFNKDILTELSESWRIVHEWGEKPNPLKACINDFKYASSQAHESMEHRWVDNFTVSTERMKQAIYDVQLCSDLIP